MGERHYKNELSAFLNQELPKEERQTIGEHLLLCDDCRREHDEIKLGTSLAGSLKQADAPDAMWTNIRAALDRRDSPGIGLMPEVSRFDLRKGFAFAAALVAVSALSIIVYVSLFSGESPYVARHDGDRGSNISASNVEPPVNVAAVPSIDSNANSANTDQQTPAPPSGASWEVEAIAGTAPNSIAVGELLETDARSRARIAVADIGTVELAPNSRVRLEETSKAEHRLALEKGMLHAKILAPPRLFIVDTPSGKAVDLGCEYTLEVDKDGNSILHVTGGWVALERGGRESMVPAGMMCMTKKGGGLGTPFSADATESFRKALENFDFSGGSVQPVVREAAFYDMFTLWHLLSRVRKDERGTVYDALAKLVPPPAKVTREGITSLDKKMLDSWKAEVENAWFN